MGKSPNGSCRNLYMRGPAVEHVSQTMKSNMVNYSKRERELMVKLKGVVVFRSHLGLYSNLIWMGWVLDVNPGAPKAPKGVPKRPRVRTSGHRTCCQNLSRQALESRDFAWETILHMFPDFTSRDYWQPNRWRSHNQQLPKEAPGNRRLEWQFNFASSLETSTWRGPAWPCNLS